MLPGLAERFDVLLFDNRGIGESDAPPGPYTVAADGRGRRPGARRGGRRARARRRDEPRRDDRAGARALVSGARRPARARLHDAWRAAGAPDAAGHGRADRGGGDARARRRAPPFRRERPRAGARSTAAPRDRRADPRAPARDGAGSRRLGGAGGGGRGVRRATTGSAELAAPTLVQHGHRGRRRRPAQQRAPRASCSRRDDSTASPAPGTSTSGSSRSGSSHSVTSFLEDRA